MMFSKALLVLPALLGGAMAQPPPEDRIEDLCYGEPVAIACDTEPYSITPMKSTLVLEDYGVTVTASIECQGTASGAVCIGEAEGGGIGVVVGNDNDLGFDTPMCYTIFFLEDGVKRYKSICRGRDFHIKQILDIDYNRPVRRLGGDFN